MSQFRNPLAVVLFQLGGPDSPEAVEPFLYNLFSDPDIIDFPFARLARPTMARLISSRRTRHVQDHYASIGGRSPIRELTERQAQALERELRDRCRLEARVFVAMRYWHPLTQEAIDQILPGGFGRIVLLPLYPQYSKTTTGSSLNEWHRRWEARGQNSVRTVLVRQFFDHPLYLDALVERINEGLVRFAPQANSSGAARPSSERLPEASQAAEVHLLFSAHGVPVKVIEQGDPYKDQIERTVRLVMQRGGWPNGHSLCWQSRVSPGKWLEPSLEETIRSLAARRVEKLLVIPIAFVSDHVETLAEIDIEARSVAYTTGMRQFEMMPALNDSPAFIRALADLVLAAAPE